MQHVDPEVTFIDEGVPHRREPGLGQPVVAGEQSPPVGPFRVMPAAASAAAGPGGFLADLGEHVVGQPNEVEPVSDQHRLGQGLAGRLGVRRGQVQAHVLALVDQESG